MDLFIIHAIVEELQSEIAGAFITKVYQMNRTDLLFRLRRQGEEKQLLISTHPDFYRLHLTEKKYANPMVPPRFCTYLRRHLTGARVDRIIQDPYERIVRLHLKKMMDAGGVHDLVLVAELLGKGSNVLLLEGERIRDCLHFRRSEEGGTRPAFPGANYSPPGPLDHWSPAEVTVERMEEIFSSRPEEHWKDLVQKIPRISPLLAREIEFLSDETALSAWKAFRFLFERYDRGAFEPRIVERVGGKKVLCPFPLKSLGPVAEEPMPSMNQAADEYYFENTILRQMTDQKHAMARRLRQLLSRLQRRQEKLAQDRENCEKDLVLKEYGDILLANFPQIKKGMRQIEAQDFRQDPPRSILIPLDDALDPAGNVQRFFKRYKKAKRGLECARERMEETEREITYLDSLLFQVEEAEDAEGLETVREELEEARIILAPKKQRKVKEKKEASSPLRRFRSAEGLEIFCGKHNVGNEYLLRRIARGNDLWFHAQGLPGSHVLLQVGPQEPKFASILEAAMIAAYYSRGRNSGRIPVDYTEVKNLRRPKGSKPGFVTYTHQKTILVKPDRDKVEGVRR